MKKLYSFILLLFVVNVCISQTITTTNTAPYCEGEGIILTVSPTTNITGYQWINNTVDIPGANAVNYTANLPGTYKVRLTRTSPSPDTTIGGSGFVINPLPITPVFSFTTNNQCASFPFNFTVTNTQPGITYTWDFGDATSTNGPGVSHLYDDNNSIGNGTHSYSVKVTARSAAGCIIQSATQNLTVSQKPSTSLGPTSLLSNYNGRKYFSKCSGAGSESFTFTNLSTTTNTSYKIIWGDGSPDFTSSSFSTTTHVYNVGTNILQFIVSGNGCTDTTIYYVFVGSNPAVGLGNPGNTNICTGTSLTFPISSTSTNTPGTTYLVTFNDGSSPLSYNHPAPTSVTHTFNSISCGTNSTTYTNSFSATIQASNPCQTSSATVVPIYVSEKPTTGFSISPKDTVCVNTNVTLTNTSLGNTFISNGVCNTGNSIWTISPSTGWAISSGTLGNDFGDIDPTIWTSGSSSLGLRFTLPGVYSVKLKAGNPNCGKDSITKTICVNSIPTALFTIDQNAGCAPLLVNANNTTAANTCGNNTFNWSVSYTPTAGCLPDTSSFTFSGGTNAGSVNPKFQFNTPGIYTISLTAIAPGGTCTSPVVTQTVTVKGKPSISITAPSSICKGESVSPTLTASCYIDAATTYAWTFNGGNPASSNSNPPGSITYNASGNYNIAVGVTNECGLTTATKPIAVNDVTIAAAGPSQNICGNTVTMNANTATVGTGTWTNVSGPNIPAITNPLSPNSTITNLIAGTYVFRWTIANGNCTSQSDVTIVISAGASAANAGTDQGLCLSNSTTLNANTPAIGTGTWSQVSGPSATITAPANASTSVSGLVPGTYVFRWTITFSNCAANIDDVQVIVYDNPSAANAGSDQTICASTVTLSANTPTIGTGTWSQIGSTPAPTTIANTTASSTSVSGLGNPGTYKFVWTIANGPCVTTKDTVEITVTQVATIANAGTDINTCIGSTVNLAANVATVGTGAWSIVSGPAGAVISNTSLPNAVVSGLSIGTYLLRWTITNGNCPASTDDVQVIVYDNPSAANAGIDQTICASAVTLTGNTPAIGNGVWTQLAGGPNTAVITNASSPSASVSGLIPGNYKFQWTISNGPCLTKQDTVEVNVTQVATTASAGTDVRQCAVSSVTLAGNTATVGAGVWTYVSGPAGYSITNASLPTTTVTGLVTGTYVFRWTITNGNCPASSDDVQVIIDENVTVSNAGPSQNKCGVSITMAANTAVVGTGLWTYVSGPAGAAITNNALPNTTITGLVPGTYVFKWTITNGSCSSFSDVDFTIFPSASAAVAGPDQDLCLATTTNLNAVAPTVGTGQWLQVSGPNTAGIANASSNSTAVNGLVPGTYIFQWTVTFSNCTPNRDTVQVKIYDNPTVAAAGTDQVICAATTSLAANSPSTGNGSWSQISGPSAATITAVNSPTSSVLDLIPGIYKFKWTISSGPCVASEDIVDVNVSAIATTANAGRDTVYCNLPSINLDANVALVGNGLWSFVSGPNTPTIISVNNNGTQVNGLIPGLYVFRWTITSGVCPASIDEVTISILKSLQNSATAPVDTICAGQQASVNGALPTGGTGSYLYQWQQSADGSNWTDIAGETNQSLSVILNSTTFFQRKVISFPCESFSNAVKIFVQPGITNNLISPNDSICINTPAPLLTGSTPNGGDGIYFYQWQQSTDGGLTWVDLAGERSIDYNPGVLSQTTKYRRLVSTALCSGPQSDVSNVITITINPDSKAIFSATDTSDCNPFDLNTVISVTHLPDSNGSYSWYADDAFIGSNSNGIFAGYSMNNPGDTVIIKLVTASQFGCKPDSMQLQFVTVRTAVANFTKDTAGGCGPLTVNFTNTSNIINPGIQFFWDFGNGISSTLAQPAPVTFVQSPEYRDTVYLVSLKAYNGCDTTIHWDSIKIRSNPKARFALDTTAGCSPFHIVVTNNSLGTPNTYYWDFGNGDRDTTFSNGSFNYTYNIGNTVDTFPVKLIAVNECASDTQVINVRVAPNIIRPQVTVSASELFGCTPHIVSFVNATTGASSFTWDYGDGSPNDVTNNVQTVITHTFNTAGTFTVTINMTNGCSDTTIYKQVTVYAKPVAGFTTNAAVYCLGDTIKVNNTTQNANNYRWFWGDGQSSSGFEPVHVYNAAGSYDIVVRAERTNNNGLVCFDTFVQRITVLIKPDVTVQSNITNINCAPFTLNATAPGIINEAVSWYITDTTVTPSIVVFNGVSTTYTFNKPGTFTVKMLAVNSIGCTDSTIKTIVVRGTPLASFTPDAIAVCKTDTTVTYQNTTSFNDFGPLTYRWLVDGALKGTNGNFTYQYFSAPNILLPRVFTTQLIATNSVGCSDTAVGVLQMNPTATAQFSLNNTNQCVPFVLPVNNASQYATSYQWYLNGLLVDTATNPSIIITQALTAYTLRLIADNGFGCRPDTFQLGFTSRIKPIAAFGLSDTLGCTGVLNVATTNNSRNANSYVWDWGDATAQSSFTNPSHLYNTQGQYVISLVASDGICRDTAYRNVYVSQKPLVDFSVNDSVTCDTARIHFTNLSSGATGYGWSFSDGTTSTAIEPDKNFPPSLSYYSVRLVAYNALGCRDSVIKPNLILAKVPPAADFIINPSPVIAIPQYTFSFDNITTNNNQYTYQWNLGDGSFESTRDVVHKYSDTGTYQVRLIVFDNNSGCPDTVIKIATIQGAPGYLYVPNAFYPNSLQQQFKTFKPLGRGLASYTFQVFDAWGKLLFQSSELDAAGSPVAGWDGTFKGTPMPQDAYAWRITAKFRNGRQWDGMSYSNNLDPKPGNTFGTVTLFR